MNGYKRDGRAPIPKKEVTSIVMRANKAKNTNPELLLRKALFRNDLKGYRLNYKKVPGRPDIAFVSKKIAIFVNGCYWHRCPKCNLPIPKSNSIFWQEKFKRNKERDKRKNRELRVLGWMAMTIWECEINKHLNKQIDKIREVYYE